MLKLNQLSGFGAGVRGVDKDAAAYIARCTNMTAACQRDIDLLVKRLKGYGIWSALDVLCVAGAADTTAHAEANALLNIRQNAYNANTSGSPSFAQNAGWTMASGTHIDTNLINDGVALYSEDDNWMGCYARSWPSAGKCLMGHEQLSAINQLIYQDSTHLKAISEGAANSVISNALGLSQVDRQTNSYSYFRTPDKAQADITAAATLPAAYSVYVGANNKLGTRELVANGAQFAAWFIGKSVSVTAAVNMQTAIQAYFTSRGTAV